MTQPKKEPTKKESTNVPPPPPIRKSVVQGTRKKTTSTPDNKPKNKPVRNTKANSRHSNSKPNRANNYRGPSPKKNRPVHFGPSRTKDIPNIKQPPRNPDGMYIIPLGGLEEIGRNSCAVEYKNDIVIIDLGLMFPSEQMYGIDYVIPDISPLHGKEKKIKGVVITHAHLDHFGAVPYLLPKLGNPPIFGSEFTMRLVQKRQTDFPQYAKPTVKIVDIGKPFKLGELTIEPFHVNHSVPKAFGVVVKSPAGSIAFTGDFKFDTNPVNDQPADEKHIQELGKKGISVLYTDSTGAEASGHSLSESTVETNLEKLFDDHPQQRIIAATFSSMIDRLQQLITVSEKHGRKVAIDGYSMKTNIEIAREIGFIKVKRDTIITPQESNKLPPNKVVILCTGAQGEDNAVLMRIVNKEHRSLELQAGDVVIFSSSVIPGNESSVQLVKDHIYKQGAEVYHYKMMDIHSSGHGHRDDLIHMIDLMKPKYLVPAHGFFSMRAEHAKLAVANNMSRDNILLPSNGEVIEITPEKVRLNGEKYDIKFIMVDGLGVGDVGNVVLRDRQILASDGMVVIIAMVNGRSGEVVGEPDIISRGFIYMKEQQQLIKDTKKEIQKVIKKQAGKNHGGEPNWSHLKANVRDDIGQFLFQQTERRPMILPIIVEV